MLKLDIQTFAWRGDSFDLILWKTPIKNTGVKIYLTPSEIITNVYDPYYIYDIETGEDITSEFTFYETSRCYRVYPEGSYSIRVFSPKENETADDPDDLTGENYEKVFTFTVTKEEYTSLGKFSPSINEDLYVGNSISKMSTVGNLTRYNMNKDEIIGFWVDNRPIYRKILFKDSIDPNTTKQFSLGIGITSIRIVNFRGVARDKNNGQTFPVPAARPDSTSNGLGTWVNSLGEVHVTTGSSNRSSYDLYMFIEYVKLADEPVKRS